MNNIKPATTMIDPYINSLELIIRDLRGRRITNEDAEILGRKIGELANTAKAARVYYAIVDSTDVFNGKDICHKCGSLLKKNWVGRVLGCIQPKCSNYYN